MSSDDPDFSLCGYLSSEDIGFAFSSERRQAW
jgi:hypothetical protein